MCYYSLKSVILSNLVDSFSGEVASKESYNFGIYSVNFNPDESVFVYVLNYYEGNCGCYFLIEAGGSNVVIFTLFIL